MSKTQSSMATQLANITNRNPQHHGKSMKYWKQNQHQNQHQNQQHQNQHQQHQNQNFENAPSKIGDKIDLPEQTTNFFGGEPADAENQSAHTPVPQNSEPETENDFQNKIPVESSQDSEDSEYGGEEDEVESESESEAEAEAEEKVDEKPKSLIVPFASQIDQEITFVVYPEEIGTDSLLPGFVHRNPFSRKGGTLRLMLENLVPTLTALEDQKILMLGDAKQATAALLPIYTQITDEAFENLLSFSAKESKEDSDFDTVGLPIDDRIFIKDGNVNLTFFSPYPDLQEDIGVKQIDNLAIWLSKLSLKNLKLNLIFAYTVEDLLDSSVNLVLNTLAQNDSLEAKVYLAKSNSFDLHPDLVKELTSSFDAFVYVTISTT